MASNPRTRASDADRDQTAAALREHLAAGRLTIDEFDERLDRAYAAKALGELDKVMADLPRTGPGQLPDAPADRPAASPPAAEPATSVRGAAALHLCRGRVSYRFNFADGGSTLLASQASGAVGFMPRARLVSHVQNTEGLALCGRGAACPG